MTRFTLMVLAAVLSVPRASAETPAGANIVCWVASMTFSPGATIRAGSQEMLCQKDGAWAATDNAAAGCFREGKLFSPGSLEAVTGSNAQIVCQPDGSWQLFRGN